MSELEFVKFYIFGVTSSNPYIYFLNTETHRSHGKFLRALGFESLDGIGFSSDEMKGEIVFHPRVVSSNGLKGVYRFEFEPSDAYSFDEVNRAHELLAANMPVLKNNLSYYPFPGPGLKIYQKERFEYRKSRINILLEEDLFSEVDYLGLNLKKGFGLLRKINNNETPRSRDIVIYDIIPTELPRVAGLISSVVQVPLSHVNLRAIQDGIPNAYIRNVCQKQEIKKLLNKYVFFDVNQNGYTLIREASITEVNNHFDQLRPKQNTVPLLDLSQKKILPLKDITFDMFSSFGVKCANLATLRTFDFPIETIPNGFGIPFYFYQEFMKKMVSLNS